MSFDSDVVCEHPRPRPRGVPLLCQRGLGTERVRAIYHTHTAVRGDVETLSPWAGVKCMSQVKRQAPAERTALGHGITAFGHVQGPCRKMPRIVQELPVIDEERREELHKRVLVADDVREVALRSWPRSTSQNSSRRLEGNPNMPCVPTARSGWGQPAQDQALNSLASWPSWKLSVMSARN